MTAGPAPDASSDSKVYTALSLVGTNRPARRSSIRLVPKPTTKYGQL